MGFRYAGGCVLRGLVLPFVNGGGGCWYGGCSALRLLDVGGDCL